MRFVKTTMLAAIASVSLVASARDAQARTYHRVDDIAVGLQRQTRDLIRETSVHLRHSPNYAHARADAIQLYRRAEHIHSVAHRRGGVNHLLEDVKKADQFFHHVEGVLKNSLHTSCHHAGCGRCHISSLLRRIENSIHRLRYEVKLLQQSCGYHGDCHFESDYEVRRRPSVGYSRGNFGVHYDGNRWAIRIGH